MSRTDEHQKAASKVTLIGALLDALLGLSKIIVGALSHSAALVADGIHSLSDLFTDFLVLFVLKISNKGPDEDHPWGHARFETVGTVILGSILIAVAGAMAYDSVVRLLFDTERLIPTWPALVVAGISIASKEAIYHYTLKVGKEISSDLIIANAWHSRSDALSSVVVLIGVAGAMAGWVWLDLFAAILVALMVAKIGWDLSWESLQELVDTALPAEQISIYKELVMSVDGIVNVHHFKSRSMGSKKVLEIHIQVPPYISASEGHRIGDEAAKKLMDRDEDMGHIIYHIDTYDDESLEEADVTCSLPLRQQIEPSVKQVIEAQIPNANLAHLNLHYDPYKIHLQILLNLDDLSLLSEKEQLIQQLRTELGEPQWLGNIYLAAGQTHA